MSKGKLLIIEDEPILCMALEDICQTLGFEILGTAATIDEGARLIDLHSDELTGVILDVKLKDGETSESLAELLAIINIPFVVSTGHDICSLSPIYRRGQVLHKPYTMACVEETLKELTFKFAK